VSKNKLGWLCETNPVSIAAMIDQIAALPFEQERVRQQAPHLIDNDFSARHLVDIYMGLYTKISTQL
jgi:hypothetical protein